MGEELKESFTRALIPDAMGFAEDDYSFMKPWGFNVEDIDVDVQIWLGTNDVFIPAADGPWLADPTKNSTLHLLQDHDQISIWVENSEQILADAVKALG